MSTTLVVTLALAAALEVSAGPDVAPARGEALQGACREVERALGPVAVRVVVTAHQAASVDEFVQRAHRARFEAAALVGRDVWLMPEEVLGRVDDVDAVLRHECVHAWLRAQDVPPLPVVIEEALALGVSGQAARLPPAAPVHAADVAGLARALAAPKDRRALEQACAAVAQAVWPPLRALTPEALLAYLRAVALDPGHALDVPLAEGALPLRKHLM